MHRDLKPQNILLGEENGEVTVKLADFGLAKYYDGKDDEDMMADDQNTFCGTPCYMAPEMMMNHQYEAIYDSEVDLWSIGLIFLEMVVPNPPWMAPGLSKG